MNKDRVKEKARARHIDTETHMFAHMGLKTHRIGSNNKDAKVCMYS